MLKHKFIGLIALAALSSSPVLAQPGQQRTAGVNFANKGMAIGFQRVAAVSAFGINQLHFMMEPTPGLWLGVGMGMDSNFNTALIGGDFRFNMAVYQGSALFLALQAGWLRVNTDGGFAGGAGLGFDIPVVGEKLRASVAYGIQFAAAIGTDNNFGITNNDFYGNFGLHWYF
jgi:hypothetical protein